MPTKVITSFADEVKMRLQLIREFTDDMAYLNRFENHIVFAYGSLKRGFLRHDAISGDKHSKFLGVAVTKDDKMDMALYPNGEFPVAIDSAYADKNRRAKIKGELFSVNTATLCYLDRLESNGTMYRRKMAQFLTGNKEVQAYIYTGIPRFWQTLPLLDLPILKPLNSQPYHFFHAGMAAKVAREYNEREKNAA